MMYHTNPGKALSIQSDGQTYIRHAIRTHFVTCGEDYLELIRHYVLPLYRPGDLLSISEKVIALCQGRVVYQKDLKPGFLARLLSRFASQSSAGIGMHSPWKMQFAIDHCGAWKVFWAALRGAVGKLFGRRGVFYTIVGREVAGLDGFYSHEFQEYGEMGIRIPADPGGVCDEIETATGVRSMIVDANNINVEILGKASSLEQNDAQLASLIRDNPAGQERYLTPFVLIRPASE